MTAHGARIKICGLTRPQDIEAVNAALPDYAGFVFAPGRRTVSLAQAAMLRQRLDRRIVPVGVFMDAPLDEVLAACSAGVVEAVQLHGSEDASYIEELKDACLVPLIKAVRLRSDGRPTHDIPHGADYVLFDGLVPGSGERAAWSVALRRYQKRFFLAGGICLANLDEALALAPWCIDVSSGAERNGIKDGALIHKLVEHTRAHGARRSRPSPQSPARAFAPCPDERASIPSPSQEERNNR